MEGILLEPATPNSTTGLILGDMLTPCNTNSVTAAISDGDNNVNLDNRGGGGGSINILKTAHDYNWAAPIMVPTSMSSLSCLGSASSSQKNGNNNNNNSQNRNTQRSMPQLTSPIRTSPLNLPRRDRSLLLSSSPRLRRSWGGARSQSPNLRVLRKPFDVISEKVADNTTNSGGGGGGGDGGGGGGTGDGEFDKEKDHNLKNNEKEPQHHDSNDHECEIAYHQRPHDHHGHHHHHRAPHLGIRISGDGPDHHTTEPITVSFSADTA